MKENGWKGRIWSTLKVDIAPLQVSVTYILHINKTKESWGLNKTNSRTDFSWHSLISVYTMRTSYLYLYLTSSHRLTFLFPGAKHKGDVACAQRLMMTPTNYSPEDSLADYLPSDDELPKLKLYITDELSSSRSPSPWSLAFISYISNGCSTVDPSVKICP